MDGKTTRTCDAVKISRLYIKAKKSMAQLCCRTRLNFKFEALSRPQFWIYIQKGTVDALTTIEVSIHYGTMRLRGGGGVHFEQWQ
jgi:hypothetical protein